MALPITPRSVIYQEEVLHQMGEEEAGIRQDIAEHQQIIAALELELHAAMDEDAKEAVDSQLTFVREQLQKKRDDLASVASNIKTMNESLTNAKAESAVTGMAEYIGGGFVAQDLYKLACKVVEVECATAEVMSSLVEQLTDSMFGTASQRDEGVSWSLSYIETYPPAKEAIAVIQKLEDARNAAEESMQCRMSWAKGVAGGREVHVLSEAECTQLSRYYSRGDVAARVWRNAEGNIRPSMDNIGELDASIMNTLGGTVASDDACTFDLTKMHTFGEDDGVLPLYYLDDNVKWVFKTDQKAWEEYPESVQFRLWRSFIMGAPAEIIERDGSVNTISVNFNDGSEKILASKERETSRLVCLMCKNKDAVAQASRSLKEILSAKTPSLSQCLTAYCECLTVCCDVTPIFTLRYALSRFQPLLAALKSVNDSSWKTLLAVTSRYDSNAEDDYAAHEFRAPLNAHDSASPLLPTPYSPEVDLPTWFHNDLPKYRLGYPRGVRFAPKEVQQLWEAMEALINGNNFATPFVQRINKPHRWGAKWQAKHKQVTQFILSSGIAPDEFRAAFAYTYIFEDRCEADERWDKGGDMNDSPSESSARAARKVLEPAQIAIELNYFLLCSNQALSTPGIKYMRPYLHWLEKFIARIQTPSTPLYMYTPNKCCGIYTKISSVPFVWRGVAVGTTSINRVQNILQDASATMFIVFTSNGNGVNISNVSCRLADEAILKAGTQLDSVFVLSKTLLRYFGVRADIVVFRERSKTVQFTVADKFSIFRYLSCVFVPFMQKYVSPLASTIPFSSDKTDLTAALNSKAALVWNGSGATQNTRTMFVYGCNGSGKTTFALNAAASRYVVDSTLGVTPKQGVYVNSIFIPLASMGKKCFDYDAITTFMFEELGIYHDAEIVALRQLPLLLVLDGLDEVISADELKAVPDNEHHRFDFIKLNRLQRSLWPKLFIVVTCSSEFMEHSLVDPSTFFRDADNKGPDGLEIWYLHPFTKRLTSEAIQKKLLSEECLNDQEAVRRSRGMYTELSCLAGLPQLLYSPAFVEKAVAVFPELKWHFWHTRYKMHQRSKKSSTAINPRTGFVSGLVTPDGNTGAHPKGRRQSVVDGGAKAHTEHHHSSLKKMKHHEITENLVSHMSRVTRYEIVEVWVNHYIRQRTSEAEVRMASCDVIAIGAAIALYTYHQPHHSADVNSVVNDCFPAKAEPEKKATKKGAGAAAQPRTLSSNEQFIEDVRAISKVHVAREDRFAILGCLPLYINIIPDMPQNDDDQSIFSAAANAKAMVSFIDTVVRDYFLSIAVWLNPCTMKYLKVCTRNYNVITLIKERHSRATRKDRRAFRAALAACVATSKLESKLIPPTPKQTSGSGAVSILSALCSPLAGLDLSYLQLPFASLLDAVLTNTDLSGSDLRGAYVEHCIWQNVNLKNTYLLGAYRLWNTSPYMGHRDWVRSICITSCGRYVVTGSDDTTVVVWSTATGEAVRTFTGHTGWVNSVDIHPDALWVVSGSWDKTIRVWDFESGHLTTELKEHEESVNCVRVLQRAPYLFASGGNDKTVRVWESGSTSSAHVLRGHTASVNGLAFGEDALFSGSADRTVKMWALKGFEMLREFTGNKGWIYCVDVLRAPQGEFIAAGGSDAVLSIWNVNTGSVREMRPHRKDVLSLRFTKDNKWMITTGKDGFIKVWSCLTWDCEREYSVYADDYTVPIISEFAAKISFSEESKKKKREAEVNYEVNSVCVDSNGSSIYSVANDFVVREWPFTAAEFARSRLRRSGSIMSHWNKDPVQGSACGVNCSSIISSRSVEKNPSCHFEVPSLVLVNIENKFCFIAHEQSKGIVCLEVDSCEPIGFYKVPNNDKVQFTALLYLDDIQLIIASCSEGLVYLWNVLSSDLVSVFKGHSTAVTSLAVRPDNKVASASDDGQLLMWLPESLEVMREFTRDKDEPQSRVLAGPKGVKTLRFKPDGTVLAAGLLSGVIQLWKITTGFILKEWEAHAGVVTALWFKGDGRSLASAGDDGLLKIWSSEGNPVAVYCQHKSPILSMSCLEAVGGVSGKNFDTVCTSDKEGYIVFWDLNHILQEEDSQQSKEAPSAPPKGRRSSVSGGLVPKVVGLNTNKGIRKKDLKTYSMRLHHTAVTSTALCSNGNESGEQLLCITCGKDGTIQFIANHSYINSRYPKEKDAVHLSVSKAEPQWLVYNVMGRPHENAYGVQINSHTQLDAAVKRYFTHFIPQPA